VENWPIKQNKMKPCSRLSTVRR